MHPSLINGFQTTPEESNNMWHWFRVQKVRMKKEYFLFNRCCYGFF